MLPIEIIHEHPQFLVCYKPETIAMHNADGQSGLLTLLKDQCSNTQLHMVHRLDKQTSGLLIIAKDHQAATSFQELFTHHKLEKTYIAIAPKGKKKQGTIKGDMAKGRRGSYKLLHTWHNPAITTFASFSMQPGLRFYVLKPITGKTHQVRVALKSISAPILGDLRYGNPNQWPVMADRLYLHCFQLCFTFSGTEYCFQAHPKTGHYFLQPLLKQQNWFISDKTTAVIQNN